MLHINIEHKGKKQEIGFSDNLDKANTFLVVGPGYYGYGESLKQARKNCIAAGAKASDTMRAYLGDESLGVTGIGVVTSKVCMFDLGVI